MATKYFVDGDKLITLSGDIEEVKLELKEISLKEFYSLKLQAAKEGCKEAGKAVKAKAIEVKEACKKAAGTVKAKAIKIKDAIKG